MASSKYWNKEYVISKKESAKKIDPTLCGDLKIFINGVKLHFTKSGSYQLVDEFGNYITIGGYSKRVKVMSFIQRNDNVLNFGNTKSIGDAVFGFTGKPNIWSNQL